MLADILEEAIVAGEASVRRGPELLPVLREAGVVDAGGYGVIVIFAGVVAALRGEAAPGARRTTRRRASAIPSTTPPTYRYCTNFAVTGARARRRALRRRPGGAGRLGPRRRRPQHAEGPRPHRRPGDGDRGLRRRRRGVAPGRGRHARPGRPARRPPGRPTATRLAARTGVLAVVSGPGWRACTSRWAPTCSTAARRSTPPRTSCWPASTRCPPRRSWSCPTAPT